MEAEFSNRVRRKEIGDTDSGVPLTKMASTSPRSRGGHLWTIGLSIAQTIELRPSRPSKTDSASGISTISTWL